MKTKLYTVLGWMAWQGIMVIGKRMLSDNKVRLGALAALAVAAVGGFAATKAAAGDDS
jgi:hypothetical protein